jgi:hypothetical protein
MKSQMLFFTLLGLRVILPPPKISEPDEFRHSKKVYLSFIKKKEGIPEYLALKKQSTW